MTDRLPALAADPAGADETFARISRRIVPTLFVVWYIAQLDRAAVAFIGDQLHASFGFGDTVIGLGMGLFYLGYCVFEIPSNLIMERVGARVWLARIMISWGLVTMATVFIAGEYSFYLLRFLLGFAEAGCYPAIILYLTYWYPSSRRAHATAQFQTSSAIAMASGSLVAALVLSTMDGVLGLADWRWLFLIVGFPAVLFGVLLYRILADRPAAAAWLSPAEKLVVADSFAAEPARATAHAHKTFWSALGMWQVWLAVGLYFFNIFGFYGLNLWMPTIIRRQPLLTDLELSKPMLTVVVSLIVAVPYVLSAFLSVWWARRSDRRRERVWHTAAPAVVAAAALVLAAVLPGHSWLVVVCMVVAVTVIFSVFNPFWAMVTDFLPPGAAAGSIALINSLGCLGGFFGPYLLGWAREHSTYPGTGYALAAGSYILFSVLTLGIARRVLRPTAASTAA